MNRFQFRLKLWPLAFVWFLLTRVVCQLVSSRSVSCTGCQSEAMAIKDRRNTWGMFDPTSNLQPALIRCSRRVGSLQTHHVRLWSGTGLMARRRRSWLNTTYGSSLKPAAAHMYNLSRLVMLPISNVAARPMSSNFR